MQDYTSSVITFGTTSPGMLKRKHCDDELPPCKRRQVEDSAKPPKILDFTFDWRINFPESPQNSKRKICHEETRPGKRLRVEGSAKPSKLTGDNSIITISSISSDSDLITGKSSSRKEESLSQKTQDQQESILNKTATFEAKYTEQNALGAGGFGQVFAGLRKADNLPVAIKHIPRRKVNYIQIDNSGRQIPQEVAIMQRLSAGRAGSKAASAPVVLLDWYEQNEEVILVMERPAPCMDLLYYKHHNNNLTEEESRCIVKQVLDALVELQDQKVFHRDIKAENILVETGGDVPRARIIDFGLSVIAETDEIFTTFGGTLYYAPPEFSMRRVYSPGPTTVWHLGTLAFELLHNDFFELNRFLSKKQTIRRTLSQNCQNFLNCCLDVDMLKRSSLEELQKHAWFQ